MKKIKLKLDSIKEMLSKEDMKKVSGDMGVIAVFVTRLLVRVHPFMKD